MTKQSEAALGAFKRVLDECTNKGGIFSNVDQVVDTVNAYNYLVSICNEHFKLTSEVNELKKSVPENGVVQN